MTGHFILNSNEISKELLVTKFNTILNSQGRLLSLGRLGRLTAKGYSRAKSILLSLGKLVRQWLHMCSVLLLCLLFQMQIKIVSMRVLKNKQ